MSRLQKFTQSLWQQLFAILLLTAFPGAALAQNAESEKDRRVQDMVTLQQRQVAVDDEGCVRYPNDPKEIVVCGTRGQGGEHRIPGRENLDSALSTENGIPAAPDIAGGGIFRGPPTVGGMCFVPPCPKPKAIETDYSKIPLADPDYLDRARNAEARARRLSAEEEVESAGGTAPTP